MLIGPCWTGHSKRYWSLRVLAKNGGDIDYDFDFDSALTQRNKTFVLVSGLLLLRNEFREDDEGGAAPPAAATATATASATSRARLPLSGGDATRNSGVFWARLLANRNIRKRPHGASSTFLIDQPTISILLCSVSNRKEEKHHEEKMERW